MSQSEGSIAPAASAPAPPSAPAAPSAPAVAPQPGSSAPAAAPPSAPAGAVPPEIAEAIAAPSTSGASAPAPSKPTTIEEAQRLFQQESDALRKQAATQPTEEAPQGEPEAPQPEIETAPVEEPAAPVEAPPQAEPVTAAKTDAEDLETILTAELIDARYPRMHKEAKAALVTREADRGKLRESIDKIGGQPGLTLAEALNPIIWNNNPTEEDVDRFFDIMVLPEHANAGRLFKMMGEHLVNVQLQDEETGKAFASNMITTEWGKQPDNQTSYDLPFVDGFIQLHKGWGVDADGKPIDLATIDMLVRGLQEGHINRELVEGDLAETAQAAKPDPEKEALRQELEALKQGKTEEERVQAETKQAEEKRDRERAAFVYKTQAKNWIRNELVKEVMALAKEANWAQAEGEESVPKTTLGKMVAAYINSELMGSAEEPATQYAELLQMIDDRTAFDMVKGYPTPRFRVKFDPFKTRAKALFVDLQRNLNPVIKFTAAQSRNAQLAKANGHKTGAANAEPPPLATTPPKPAGEPQKSAAQLIEENRRAYEKNLQAIKAGQQVGQLQ